MQERNSYTPSQKSLNTEHDKHDMPSAGADGELIRNQVRDVQEVAETKLSNLTWSKKL